MDPFRHDLATTGHDETTGCLSLTGLRLDDCPGVDGQDVTGVDIDESVQHVHRVTGQGSRASSRAPIIGQVHHRSICHRRTGTILGLSPLNEEKAEGKQQARMNRLLHGDGHLRIMRYLKIRFFDESPM